MNGKLPDAWLDELRSRSSLEEVVSEYVPLKQKGKRFWGCCPFHREKTPSFSVDTISQMYYCFGCHKGGTVITFVMDMERMEFMDAVRYLADRAHMDLPEMTAQSPDAKVSRDERERMFEANRVAARYFHTLLKSDVGAEALNYLYRRGLNDADIRSFGLGASPAGGDDLLRYMGEQGYEAAVLEKCGLVVRREGRLRDMFRGRVMFPIINPQGRVLGFGGRIMGDGQPKYLNTAETPIFNKRMGLYALNMAKNERAAGRLVLVEGYMDTVSLRKYGVQGVVATLGTALTEEQARLMKRYAPEVWVSYDGDAAGQKAALRALDILDGQGVTARVIDYPDGMDPDDFIRANGLEGFESLPKHDSTSYRMLRARDGLDTSTQEGMTQYAMRCCAILRRVKSPIEMENHLRRLIDESGYDRQTLLRQIGTVSIAERREPRPRRIIGLGQPGQRGQSGGTQIKRDVLGAEQALLTMLAEGTLDVEMLRREDFSDPAHIRLAEWLISGKAAGPYIEQLTDEEERSKVMNALNYQYLPQAREDRLAMAEECLKTIRRARVSQREAQLRSEISGADPDKRAALYAQALAARRSMSGERNGEDSSGR